mmetsp:Transcript_15635/g.37145  ORF Transcript_15635/g.37145 Transcript_15635/m.37145 type:complete len:199 (+) Transcript_15635:1086-1682(+)
MQDRFRGRQVWGFRLLQVHLPGNRWAPGQAAASPDQFRGKRPSCWALRYAVSVHSSLRTPSPSSGIGRGCALSPSAALAEDALKHLLKHPRLLRAADPRIAVDLCVPWAAVRPDPEPRADREREEGRSASQAPSPFVCQTEQSQPETWGEAENRTVSSFTTDSASGRPTLLAASRRNSLAGGRRAHPFMQRFMERDRG